MLAPDYNYKSAMWKSGSSYPRILIFAHVERRLDVARHRCLDLDVVLRTFGQPLRVQVPRLN